MGNTNYSLRQRKCEIVPVVLQSLGIIGMVEVVGMGPGKTHTHA
jgi:hypothetical protein